jgi:hypothetical protein
MLRIHAVELQTRPLTLVVLIANYNTTGVQVAIHSGNEAMWRLTLLCAWLSEPWTPIRPTST